MQAIITKVIPATNRLATRIKATCPAGTITIQASLAEDQTHLEPNVRYTGNALAHRYVIKELLRRLDWHPSSIHTGDLPNGDYVHVLEY